MTALPMPVGRLSASADALERMRHDLGETRIQQSRPGSLRERYGIFGGVNCLHLSDAPETGSSEVSRWAKFVQLDKIDAGLDVESEKPDHTFHLRSLATQVAGGIHADLASQTMRELIADEASIERPALESLSRIILGAVA